MFSFFTAQRHRTRHSTGETHQSGQRYHPPSGQESQKNPQSIMPTMLADEQSAVYTTQEKSHDLHVSDGEAIHTVYDEDNTDLPCTPVRCLSAQTSCAPTLDSPASPE